jgi:hemolysin activation/secretion protein
MCSLATASIACAQDAPNLVATIVRGADRYSSLQLLPTYQTQLGKPITNSTVEQVAAAIVELYVDDGYSQPELQLDNSQFASGIITIDVFEAALTEVTITGDMGPYAKDLAALRVELLALQPLRTQALQTILRRARELPSLTVTVTTKRDPNRRNGHILNLDAQFKTWANNVRLTNRGTKEVGRDFMIAQTVASGLMGRDLRAGLVAGVAQSSREFRGAGAFVDVPIVTGDTRTTLLAFRSLSDPTENPVNFAAEYQHNRVSLALANRWQSVGKLELKIGGDFELDDLYLEQDGTQLQADLERVLAANVQMQWQEKTTQYLTVLGVRQGLNALGAGLSSVIFVEPGRSVGFTVINAQVVRQSQPWTLWTLRFDAFAQYSNDVLSDRERFKIGGDRLGRGFEVPAIAGDSGAGAKAELRRDLPKLKSRFASISTYAYYDIGIARVNSYDIHESAASAGIGLTLQGKSTFGSLEVAKPLTHPDVDGNRDATVFAELSVNF